MIKDLISFEENMLEKYQQSEYKKESLFQKDVEKLLNDLSVCHNNIKTKSELKWVCNAIVRWKYFLNTTFNVYKVIPVPSIDEIPSLQKDEDVIEEREDVHESGGKTLEDLAKNVETLHHNIDQLMTKVYEKQNRTQKESRQTYTDLKETIGQGFGYMGKQLTKHDYEMSKQHEEQTGKILDASGEPYSGKETTTKTVFADYPRWADTGLADAV